MGFFDKCCFCIELRLGCLIIGYINLVGTIIGVALAMMILLAGGVVAGNADTMDTQQEREAAAMVGTVFIAAAGIALLFLFVLLAFNIVLLVGLHQNKRGHVRAYLIYSYVFIVLGVLGFLGMFAAPVKAEFVIRNLISLLLFVYFTLVIRSHHQKMDNGKRPAIYNTA